MSGIEDMSQREYVMALRDQMRAVIIGVTSADFHVYSREEALQHYEMLSRISATMFESNIA